MLRIHFGDADLGRTKIAAPRTPSGKLLPACTGCSPAEGVGPMPRGIARRGSGCGGKGWSASYAACSSRCTRGPLTSRTF